MKDVLVPDIGDFKEVEVIEILVKPGDTIAKEQSLVSLESDKATMEIPAPEAGVVKELKIKVGDKVSQGSAILVLEEAKGDGETKAAAPPAPQKAQDAPAPEKAKSEPTPAPAEKSAGPMTVKVPDIGDFKEVEVIEILVKPGDTVTKEQSLVSLESDKATMEIPSPAAGKIAALKIKVGDKVSQGSVILELEAEALAEVKTAPEAGKPESNEPTAKAAPSTPPVVTHVEPVPPEPKEALQSLPHASPSIRKFARELGVDLTRVQGSGPKGRIVIEDVQSFVKSAISENAAGKSPSAAGPAGKGGLLDVLPWPDVDFGKFGPVELQARSRIKKLAAANLHRNWVMIPHVTHFDEADITELEAFRKSNTAETEKQGFKLTMLAFLIKASVTALRQFPDFNASLDKTGENLVLKKYFHIGVAVDTPEGLMVPVIRDADRKGVFDLARELAEISKRARDKKLKAGDMQGGTFSISSLGGIGGTAFTPIINAPEVAILGVARSALRPVHAGKDDKGKDLFNARLMLPLALSYDHRVIDGALAARFTAYLSTVLSDIRRTLL